MFLAQCMNEKEALLLNPLQLAYMGDSVWEIIVRSRLIQQRKNVHHMHDACVETVNAGAQARGLAIIRSELTEQERAIVQRGRNAHSKHPSPKNQNPGDYAEATGFEALLGYLFLTDNYLRLEKFAGMILDHEEGERETQNV